VTELFRQLFQDIEELDAIVALESTSKLQSCLP